MDTAVLQQTAKKLTRSVLFQVPPVYRAVTSEYRYLLLHRLRRVHEPEFALVAPLLPPRPLVLDVGGNIGQSVLSVMACMPESRVVSFEPNPGPAEVLERVAARFSGRVEVCRCGLGPSGRREVLHVPTYRGKEMTGLASYDLEEAAGWINEERVFFFDAAQLTVEQVPVETRRLDDFDYEPDLLKIDVQGFELEVVLGGLATIERSHPVIVAEHPDPVLVDLLADRGYAMAQRRGGALAPSETLDGNQVFLPPGTGTSLRPTTTTGPTAIG